MVTYPAILDVPRELGTFLAELLAGERRNRGTRAGTRAPSCGKQALFALVWFASAAGVALTGKGLGISQATSYRYLDEVIGVLAARAPDLHGALQRGQDEGWSHVVLDGKVARHQPAAGQDTQHEGHHDRCLVLGEDPRLRG